MARNKVLKRKKEDRQSTHSIIHWPRKGLNLSQWIETGVVDFLHGSVCDDDDIAYIEVIVIFSVDRDRGYFFPDRLWQILDPSFRGSTWPSTYIYTAPSSEIARKPEQGQYPPSPTTPKRTPKPSTTASIHWYVFIEPTSGWSWLFDPSHSAFNGT